MYLRIICILFMGVNYDFFWGLEKHLIIKFIEKSLVVAYSIALNFIDFVFKIVTCSDFVVSVILRFKDCYTIV